MNTKHTPGPWIAHEDAIFQEKPHGEVSPLICDTINGRKFTGEERGANARRIVACVNACEGINPEAVPELRDICESILAKVAAAMPARHDDLTAVSVTFTGADLARLRAAIAKATNP